MHAICSVDAPNAFGASTEFVRLLRITVYGYKKAAD